MRHPLATPILLLAAALPAHADVLDSAANGFTVRTSVAIAASREDVYNAAVRHVGDWWSDEHTVSKVASNLSIDPRPQGCFCESLGENAGLVHLTVTFVNPQVMIRFNGTLGPLGLMGVDGNMTWEFDDDAGGSKVTLTYAVGGYLAGGLDGIASAVDGVLSEQMLRLKDYVEKSNGED